MTFGERIVPADRRYIKHPSTSELNDGAPIDAETSMLAHSNLSTLSERGCRVIGHARPFVTFPYTVTTGKDDVGSAYAGLVDVDLPANPNPTTRIPWTLNDCVRFGPIPAVAVSFSVAPPGYLLRLIRIVTEWWGSIAETYNGIAYLTIGNNPPRTGTNILASASFGPRAGIAAWEQWVADLVPPQPATPFAEWISRAGSASESSVSVVELYAWVSISEANGGSGPSVRAVSAYEVW